MNICIYFSKHFYVTVGNSMECYVCIKKCRFQVFYKVIGFHVLTSDEELICSLCPNSVPDKVKLS